MATVGGLPAYNTLRGVVNLLQPGNQLLPKPPWYGQLSEADASHKESCPSKGTYLHKSTRWQPSQPGTVWAVGDAQPAVPRRGASETGQSAYLPGTDPPGRAARRGARSEERRVGGEGRAGAP